MKYKIELTIEEIGYVNQVLIERPFKEVVVLLNNLNQQVQAQNKQEEALKE